MSPFLEVYIGELTFITHWSVHHWSETSLTTSKSLTPKPFSTGNGPLRGNGWKATSPALLRSWVARFPRQVREGYLMKRQKILAVWVISHRIHVWYIIFAYIWLNFMGNVDEYTIHGYYGYRGWKSYPIYVGDYDKALSESLLTNYSIFHKVRCVFLFLAHST